MSQELYSNYIKSITDFTPGYYTVIYNKIDEPSKGETEYLRTSRYYSVMHRVPFEFSQNKDGQVTKVKFTDVIHEETKKCLSQMTLDRKTKLRNIPKYLTFRYPYKLRLPEGFCKYTGCEGTSYMKVWWLDTPKDVFNFDKYESPLPAIFNFDIKAKPNTSDVPFAISVGQFYPV